MTPPQPLAALLAALSTVVFVACSNGQQATTVSTVVPTTAPAETTTAPTSTSTTSTTTTLAPTTTLDPLDEIAAAIQESRFAAEAAYFAAASDPTNQELRDIYRTYYTIDFFEPREDFLDRLVSEGLRLRRGDSAPSSITFGPQVEWDASSEDVAFLMVCRIDSDVIFLPSSADVPEAVIDDRVLTTLARTRFERVGDRWILADGQAIKTWNGPSACEF